MAQRRGSNIQSLRVSKELETLRERTVNRLREAILNQHYVAGDRLVERELCEATGVSRTSVREALRQLESEGLVETVPHRGPVVATVSAEDAGNIYELREALEGLAGRLFADRATKQQVQSLVRASKDVVRAARKRNVPKSLAALDAFYDVLFDGCGNPIAGSVIRTLRARMHLLRATTTHRLDDASIARTAENFERIAASVEARDGAAAQAACVEQVRFAAEYAAKVMADRETAAGASHSVA